MKATITIPDNINEISLGQYQRYLTVTEGIEGEFLAQRTVEVFCGIPFSNVILMSHKDVKEISQDMVELVNKDVDFQHRFKIQSQEFGFMPDMEEMTSGEFADLCAYIGKPEDMHKAMAVMFRPITNRVGDKYDIYPYNGSKEFGDLMKFMPLGIALGAMVFFYNLAKELANATHLSILQEMEKEISQDKQISQKDGDSIRTSIRSHKEKYSTLIE
jgi:hypothetical protein